MKRAFFMLAGLLCLLVTLSCGVAETAQGIDAVIDGGNADRVHLRAWPSTNSESLGLYFTGTELLCQTDPAQEWTRVIVGSQEGYMKSEFLRWGDDRRNVQPRQPLGIVQTQSGVNLRNAPSTEGQIEGKLRDGDRVTILGETATHWYYIAAADTTGYASATYVSMTKSAPDGSAPDMDVNRGELYPYKLVLKNEARLLSASDGQSLYLEQLRQLLEEGEGYAVRFTRFALADVDGDTQPEVVLKLSAGENDDYGFEVLDDQNGAVYGYEAVYRALNDLKADGTFSFASSASDTGFGRFEFRGNEYGIKETAYSAMTEDGSIRYVHNGTPITKSAYDRLLDAQDKKGSAVWYDFTGENVERLFGERY